MFIILLMVLNGLAISGAILILLTLLLTFYIANHTSNLVPLFLILFVSCLGFLFFNWPKASIFMGDSGSIFLGYCFGAFIVYSLMNGEISFLTWLSSIWILSWKIQQQQLLIRTVIGKEMESRS